jgi:hypothetical protein
MYLNVVGLLACLLEEEEARRAVEGRGKQGK